MTTETTRTRVLWEALHHYEDDDGITRVPTDELHRILGAASRASPDEGRAVEVDEAISSFERAVRDNERGTDPRVPPMVVSILRNALRMIALRPPPAPTETREPPPLCTGSGTVNAAFMPVATSLPTKGTCGICHQTVPLMPDGTTTAPHGYRAPAPSPEDSGAREAVKDDEKLSPQPCRKCSKSTVYYTEGGETTTDIYWHCRSCGDRGAADGIDS